jgi:Mg-chelatase subunit ChlD
MLEFSFDDWIDAQLRNVPLPPRLLERLAADGTARAPDDAELDAALCDVPVPVDLPMRLRRIARRRRSTPMWRQVALAASLFLVIGLGTIGYLGLITGAVDPAEPRLPGAKQPPSAVGTLANLDARPATPDAALASQRAPANPPQTPTTPNPVAPVPVEDVASDDRPDSEATPVTFPKQRALGAGGTLDRLPDLDVFEASPPRGMSPPLVRGYDLLFQLRHGEHPFVSPDAHQDLTSTKLPFTFGTASFDMALRAVRKGELPAADEIRIEDFLAAQEYAFPEPPAGGLVLHVAASRSPLAAGAAAMQKGNLHLLELAVQAATYDVHEHHPNWLIVAVDTSSRMRSSARLASVRRALAKLAAHMGDRDRVTLLRFSDQPTVVAQSAGSDELKKLAWSDALIAQDGTADLAGAIRAAWNIARDTETLDPRRVVVITGDRGNFDRSALPQSAEQLGQLADMNIPWQMIRVAADENDALWDQLAEKARGQIVAERTGDGIYRALLEALTGWPPTVADDVSLTLSFRSQQVHSYRLLGHEATTLTGGSTDPVQVDLGADQTAIGLYEVSLKPNTGKIVGSVEVTWHDPATGEESRITGPILRDQLSGSFFSAPTWFQESVIAAKAAESLRGSYYAPRAHPVVRILDLAQRVDPGIAAEADFQQLLELLDAARKLR